MTHFVAMVIVPGEEVGHVDEYPWNQCPGKTKADKVVPVLPVRASALDPEAPRGRRLLSEVSA